MKTLVSLIILLCSLNSVAQTKYTIYLVNESDSPSEKIEIGRRPNSKKMGPGDIVMGNNCKVWWTDKRQSIEVLCSADGEFYTIYASKYYKAKDIWKERFSNIDYICKNKLASRGEKTKSDFLYLCISGDKAMVEGLINFDKYQDVLIEYIDNYKVKKTIIHSGIESHYILFDLYENVDLVCQSSADHCLRLVYTDRKTSEIKYTSLKVLKL